MTPRFQCVVFRRTYDANYGADDRYEYVGMVGLNTWKDGGEDILLRQRVETMIRGHRRRLQIASNSEIEVSCFMMPLLSSAETTDVAMQEACSKFDAAFKAAHCKGITEGTTLASLVDDPRAIIAVGDIFAPQEPLPNVSVTLSQTLSSTQEESAHAKEDDESFLTANRATSIEQGIRAPSPSIAAQMDQIAVSQRKFPIYDGRRVATKDMRGPQIELFHQVFGKFRHLLASQAPLSSTDYDNTRRLMDRLCIQDRYEDQREGDLHRLLEALCNQPIDKLKLHAAEMDPTESVKNVFGTRGDGVAYCTVDIEGSGIRVPLVHYEIKSKLANGHGCPLYQGSSCARKWAVSSALKKLRNVSCMPCFLVVCVGPEIHVLGFIFTDIAVVQPLIRPIYVTHQNGAFRQSDIHTISRLFSALRDCLAHLSQYYQRQTPSDTMHLNCISPQHTDCTFSDINHTSYPVKLEYGKQLRPETRWRPIWKARIRDIPTYVTEMQDGTMVVVKFTDRYHEQAHHLLAQEGLAPKLFSCAPLGDGSKLIMVVMEYIEGIHSEALKVTHLPQQHHHRVRQAIQLLHNHHLVFGDLRLPNIMIRHADQQALLVDFDWCGTDDEVRYPCGMILRYETEGIMLGAHIVRSHDEFMYKQITGVQF